MADSVRKQLGGANPPDDVVQNDTGVFRRQQLLDSQDAPDSPPAHSEPLWHQPPVMRCARSPSLAFAERDSKRCSPDGPRLVLRDLVLSFSVSRDEEYVHLAVIHRGGAIDLGARTRNYLLLTLARRRLVDAAEGLPETTCGWVYHADLEHDPSMAPPQLNIDVFRLRKQFASVGVVDAADIIERRPRTRQLRIGTGRIAIARL
jgi:hypothetical protein